MRYAQGTGGGRHLGWLPEACLIAGLAGLAATATILVVTAFWVEFTWWAGMASMLAAAVVVRYRRPDHRLSGWFLIGAAMTPLADVGDKLYPVLFATGATAMALPVMWLLSSTVTNVATAAMARPLALLPDGRVERGYERRVLAAFWGLVLIPFVLAASSPSVPLAYWIDLPEITNPLHVAPWTLGRSTADAIGGAVTLAALASWIVLLVARYRRASPARRRPFRWLLAPLVMLVIASVLHLLLSIGGGGEITNLLVNLLYVLEMPLLAVALTFAMLQPGNVDPDRVLRRMLVFGVLWLAIAGAYIAVGSFVGMVAGRSLPLEGAILLTVVATLLFQPARVRLQRIADRWVFGGPADRSRIIADLGASLADTYDLDDLLPRMAATLQEGLGLAWARIRLDTAAAAATMTEPALTVPIEHGGERLGVIECGPSTRGVLTGQDRKVVESFARQAALAVRNVRLTTRLVAQAQQLATSRTRLVRAQDEERRRIERNIHDGVQQELVALISQAGHLKWLQDRRPGDVNGELAELHGGLQRVLDDLRSLARGIHPPLLSDRGLLAAVEALAARNPVPVALRVGEGIEGLRMPDEIEGAAYFTVAEALANVTRHAGADSVEVSLSHEEGTLAVEVTDDGVGFDPGAIRGSGLVNLDERAQALGGSVLVDSAAGEGTTVRATLPTALDREAVG